MRRGFSNGEHRNGGSPVTSLNFWIEQLSNTLVQQASFDACTESESSYFHHNEEHSMQKRFFLMFSILFLVALSSTTLFAQGMMRMTPEERAKALKDSLGLDEKQTAQIVSIFSDMGKQRQAMMDSLEDRDARRDAMMKLMTATDDKIESLLTPDQKDKYEAMKKAREARFRRGPN